MAFGAQGTRRTKYQLCAFYPYLTTFVADAAAATSAGLSSTRRSLRNQTRHVWCCLAWACCVMLLGSVIDSCLN